MAESHENYGSVDLKLTPDWDRSRFPKDAFLNATVGHTNGTADAYKTKSPRDRHQFAWWNPKHEDVLDILREKGYDFVTDKKDDWTVNPKLWQRAEGRIRRLGDFLMARPAQLWIDEGEEKARTERDLDELTNARLAKHPGANAGRTAQGEPLRPTVRA